jgi:iron complex outermembrane receptor protein
MKNLLIPFLLATILSANAQISGRVVDDKKSPLAGAIVRILNGDKFKRTILTDTAGYFTVNTQQMDRIIISAIGYRPDTIFTIKKDLGTITLRTLATQLKEVEIKAKQSLITQQIDRSIIRVNNEIKKLANNSLEIVGLAPGISISDNQDAILMSGKSDLQIMINNKVVKMSPSDVVKMLRAMPVGSVRQVELLSNPPAKFEVNGNTGIINIITAQPTKGMTGSLDMSTSQGDHNWSDLSGILNYGTGSLVISGYTAYHRGGYLTKTSRTRKLNSGNIAQYTENLDSWSDPVFSLAADYNISKYGTIGGVIEREASTNTGSYRTTTQQSLATVLTDGKKPNTRHWNTYNLSYRYNDTLGTDLTIDLGRANFDRESRMDLTTTAMPALNYDNSTSISIGTLKADYTRSLKHKLKLEAGVKLAEVITHNTQNANAFSYRENIRAAYSAFSQQHQNWGWQVGLRVEQTAAKGQSDQNVQPDTAYANLLPSAYLSWIAGPNHHFRLSLSRRIKRPNYSDLEPFVYVIDPLNLQTGNPSLSTQRNDQVELTYTFKEKITIIANYAESNDYFATVYRESGSTLIQLPFNAGKMQTWNVDLNYPIKVNKWWNMLSKVNVGNDHFSGQLFQGFLDQHKWRYQLSTSQRLTIKNYQLQLSGRYTSASQNLIYRQLSSGNLSASLSRKLLKNQASIRIGITDILKTQRSFTDVNFGDLRYTDRGTFESRRISFNFAYRFGNTKIRQTAERDRGDAEEKGRSGT